MNDMDHTHLGDHTGVNTSIRPMTNAEREASKERERQNHGIQEKRQEKVSLNTLFVQTNK
jgi:hypothetical protein